MTLLKVYKWAEVSSRPKLFRTEVFPGRSIPGRSIPGQSISGPKWVSGQSCLWAKLGESRTHHSVTKLGEVFFCRKIELIEFTDSWLNSSSFFSMLSYPDKYQLCLDFFSCFFLIIFFDVSQEPLPHTVVLKNNYKNLQNWFFLKPFFWKY